MSAAVLLCASASIGASGPDLRSGVGADVAPPGAHVAKRAASPFGALLVHIRARSEKTSIAQALPPAPEPGSPLSAALLPTRTDRPAPLPPGRPAEFRWPTSHAGAWRAPSSSFGHHNRIAAPATEPGDNRTLFETFFGAPQSAGPKASTPALAYAAPESGPLDDARRVTSGPLLGYDRWTAVYDISAHTVHLPDGTKLEAHSGLGDKLDNPRFVHVKMRGATPPSVYELSLRERPFHGVRALRLTPVGDGDVFGRAGLLAHTYMLGPRGDSNGCVVFKNYDAFLRAFQNGQIKRLAVVGRLG